MMNRRTFLKQTGAFSAALLLPACLNKVKEEKKNPYLLVVSGWQDVNIGDIAHTPGLLHKCTCLMQRLLYGNGAKARRWKHY